MDAILLILAWVAAGAFGYMIGRWNGYKDALPKRDTRGRFTKER